MKRSQSAACIDLTGDDFIPAQQRRRTVASGSRPHLEDLEDPLLQQALHASLADPDVEVIEPEPRSVPKSSGAEASLGEDDGDEDLAVLGTTGQVCVGCAGCHRHLA